MRISFLTPSGKEKHIPREPTFSDTETASRATESCIQRTVMSNWRSKRRARRRSTLGKDYSPPRVSGNRERIMIPFGAHHSENCLIKINADSMQSQDTSSLRLLYPLSGF